MVVHIQILEQGIYNFYAIGPWNNQSLPYNHQAVKKKVYPLYTYVNRTVWNLQGRVDQSARSTSVVNVWNLKILRNLCS